MFNVLLYIVDSLRADHLGCYGYGRPTTPHLDALAAEPYTVRFARAYSTSTWTKPAAASILSGCYPPAHAVRTRVDLFTRSVPRLPSLLQSAGYRTLAVSAIGNVSSSLGFGIGFDRFVDLYKDASLAGRRAVSTTAAWKLYFEADSTVVLPLAEDVNAVAMPWLEEQRRSDRPWFLFLWTLDPHDPYRPPPGYDRWLDPAYRGRVDGSTDSIRRARTPADVQRLVDLYDGEVAYADAQIGHLLEHLRRLGLYEQTLVVVAGDHGEAFGEHGDFVHGHLAREEVWRVPLLIKFPAALRPARNVCDSLAQLTDIAPTVLDVVGLGRLAEGMQGYSLLPQLRWRTAPPRPAIYAETQASTDNHRLLAVSDGRWKYLRVDPPGDYTAAAPPPPQPWRRRLLGYLRQLRNPAMLRRVLQNPMFYVRRQTVGRELLFDLAEDPAERHNLAEQRPDVVQEMSAMLEAWLVECRVYGSLSDVHVQGLGLDADTRQQLEGLGYL